MRDGLYFLKEFAIICPLVLLGMWVFVRELKQRAFLAHGGMLLTILTLAYFSFHFLVFALLTAFMLSVYFKGRRTIDKMEIYLLLLPFLPVTFFSKVPFPGLEQLLTLNYPDLLALIILCPLFFASAFRSRVQLFTNPVDLFVVVYFLYWFLTAFRDTTFTNGFRAGGEIFLESLLVYFVVSRTMSSRQNIERVAPAMIFSGFVLALVGIFESVRHWQLFLALNNDPMGWGHYVERSGYLRASGPLMGPIAFGLYLSIIMGFAVYLGLWLEKKKFYLWGVVTTLFLGILATFSRGALAAACLFFVLLGLQVKHLAARIFLPMFLVFGLLLISPFGSKVIASLPFVGHEEQETVSYRQKLVENSMIVVGRNVWMGSNDVQEQPEIQALRQVGWLPGGKVDIVNTYLGITLEKGVIGLMIFLLVILAALAKITRAIRRLYDPLDVLLGKVLLSLTVSLLVSIYTVSFITAIPLYFWILIGLCAGYEGTSTAARVPPSHDKVITKAVV